MSELELTLSPNLSKSLIESKVSQESLMATYYGESIHKGLFKARHRQDSRPTVAYYKNKSGRLIVKDFGSDYQGDWIFVLMDKYSCSYGKALSIAANDFNIIKDNDIKVTTKIKDNQPILEEKKQSKIQVEIREFQDYELNWWLRYGITKQTLDKFKVFSCKNIWLNDNLFYLEKENQYVFGYYGGLTTDNIEYWKIYFPYKRTYRFIGNWPKTKLQGSFNLPKEGGELLIITKSMKDVMCLYELGYTAIAPNSEVLFVTDKVLEKLKNKFNKVIVIYDNDKTGIANLDKIKSQYSEISTFYIPLSYEAKDISDFYKKYGETKTKEFLKQYLHAT